MRSVIRLLAHNPLFTVHIGPLFGVDAWKANLVGCALLVGALLVGTLHPIALFAYHV
jgi:hypothetical protein